VSELQSTVTKEETNRVELVTGSEFCPHCLSKNITKTDSFEKCEDCGMGHYFKGRRY